MFTNDKKEDAVTKRLLKGVRKKHNINWMFSNIRTKIPTKWDAFFRTPCILIYVPIYVLTFAIIIRKIIIFISASI